MTEPGKSTLRSDLEKLNALGQDIAKMSSKLGSITNLMVHAAMKKSVDEMTREQNALARALVSRSTNEEARKRFDVLAARIDSAEQQVRDCNDPEELKQLGQDLEKLVDEWVQLFQEIVADLLRQEKEQQQAEGPPST